jgi:hypothetical protein
MSRSETRTEATVDTDQILPPGSPGGARAGRVLEARRVGGVGSGDSNGQRIVNSTVLPLLPPRLTPLPACLPPSLAKRSRDGERRRCFNGGWVEECVRDRPLPSSN